MLRWTPGSASISTQPWEQRSTRVARSMPTAGCGSNTPSNTESVGLTYAARGWYAGMFNKRVGRMFNDNGSLNQAVTIDPFNVTNLFVNYTIRGDSYLRGTKIRFGINNLFDQRNIVGISRFSAKSNAPAPWRHSDAAAGAQRLAHHDVRLRPGQVRNGWVCGSIGPLIKQTAPFGRSRNPRERFFVW